MFVINKKLKSLVVSSKSYFSGVVVVLFWKKYNGEVVVYRTVVFIVYHILVFLHRKIAHRGETVSSLLQVTHGLSSKIFYTLLYPHLWVFLFVLYTVHRGRWEWVSNFFTLSICFVEDGGFSGNIYAHIPSNTPTF